MDKKFELIVCTVLEQTNIVTIQDDGETKVIGVLPKDTVTIGYRLEGTNNVQIYGDPEHPMKLSKRSSLVTNAVLLFPSAASYTAVPAEDYNKEYYPIIQPDKNPVVKKVVQPTCLRLGPDEYYGCPADMDDILAEGTQLVVLGKAGHYYAVRLKLNANGQKLFGVDKLEGFVDDETFEEIQEEEVPTEENVVEEMLADDHVDEKPAEEVLPDEEDDPVDPYVESQEPTEMSMESPQVNQQTKATMETQKVTPSYEDAELMKRKDLHVVKAPKQIKAAAAALQKEAEEHLPSYYLLPEEDTVLALMIYNNQGQQNRVHGALNKRGLGVMDYSCIAKTSDERVRVVMHILYQLIDDLAHRVGETSKIPTVCIHYPKNLASLLTSTCAPLTDITVEDTFKLNGRTKCHLNYYYENGHSSSAPVTITCNNNDYIFSFNLYNPKTQDFAIMDLLETYEPNHRANQCVDYFLIKGKDNVSKIKKIALACGARMCEFHTFDQQVDRFVSFRRGVFND